LSSPKDPTPAPIVLRIPDLGDVKDVTVLEVLVRVGDRVEVDTPLVTLESEKATMDVPSTAAGTIASFALRQGDKVASGAIVATLVAAPAASSADDTEVRAALRVSEPYGGEPYLDTVPLQPMPTGRGGTAAAASLPAGAPTSQAANAYDFDLLVIGAGPGGYTAAFRAADLGLSVALVERDATLGGVCLNVGCIPSKALLHAARVIEDAAAMADHGLRFGSPEIDAARLRDWKNSVVRRLTQGLDTLARQRKVSVLRGRAAFSAAHEIELDEGGATRRVSFDRCIVAVGSEPMRLPGWPDDPRIIDSTGALELELPSRLLVVGGGIIGLEMATVYDALGVRVSVVELTPGLMPGCDRDLVRPLEKRIAGRYEQILLKTRVTGVETAADGLRVAFEGEGAPRGETYDKVLVAVGRTPNGGRINAAAAGVKVDGHGYIPVDRQMRTNVAHVFAIGDVTGPPMLAHKATHEGKVAAEVAAGLKSHFDARAIPSVAYTDPEIAWVGLTETEARTRNVAYEKAVFPWAASGRSLAIGRDEGLTKLLFDPVSHRVIGGGIVGSNAGDLISEVVLAMEMDADAGDIALTIHPHPTLSETVAFAAEAFEGTLTDLYLPKKKGPAARSSGG
jgi:dihydrolipoamide dehydrogenase